MDGASGAEYLSARLSESGGAVWVGRQGQEEEVGGRCSEGWHLTRVREVGTAGCTVDRVLPLCRKPSLTEHRGFKVHPRGSLGQSSTPFHGWVTFHCVHGPQAVSPSIRPGTFGWLLPFGDDELRRCKHVCV